MKKEFQVKIEYRAFFLRPDIPPEGIPRPERYNRPDSPVQKFAEEAGIVMNRPAIVPYTRFALEATEYAKRQGLGEEFHMKAYDAYWRDGVDLGKVENLKPIAESVGLPWSELASHLEHRTYQEAVEGQYQEALQVGVTGIPAYVIGRFFFTGAQPYEMFRQVAERALLRIESGEDPSADSAGE